METGRSIITTQTRVKAVNALQDYWKVKGLLTRITADPSLSFDPDVNNTLMDFLERHSELPTFAFWNRLDLDQKSTICKHVNVIDKCIEKALANGIDHVEKALSPATITITCVPQTAEIYVVLSGTVIVTSNMDSIERTYSQGKIFGSIDIFENSWKSEYSKESNSSNSNKSGAILLVEIEKCSVLRIGFQDYFTKVVSPPVEEVIHDEDEQALEKLSPDEAICIRIRRQAKKSLSATLFNFLTNFSMIPESAASPSFVHVFNGNIGREIVLSRSGPRMVYVIIDGSVLMEIKKPKGSAGNSLLGKSCSRTSTITCNRKGEKALVVKTKRMPLMLIEVGGIIALSEDCYSVSSSELTSMSTAINNNTTTTTLKSSSGKLSKTKSSKGAHNITTAAAGAGASALIHTNSNNSHNNNHVHHSSHHGTPPTTAGNNAGSGSTGGGGGSAGGGMGIAGSAVVPASVSASLGAGAGMTRQTIKKLRDAKAAREQEQELYTVHMTFQRPTMYLAIPLQELRQAMKETSFEVNREINSQLSVINSLLVKRINDSIAWIEGNMSIQTRDNSTDSLDLPKLRSSAGSYTDEGVLLRDPPLLCEAPTESVKGSFHNKLSKLSVETSVPMNYAEPMYAFEPFSPDGN